MEATGTLEKARSEHWTDEEVIDRVKAGDTALYELIMRRYNQRLYRVARAILRDDAEAEDVMQDAYVRAFQHLDQFAARAPFSAWLTRIAVHEALARLRLRSRSQQLEDAGQDGEFLMTMADTSPDPEQIASSAEMGRLLEDAVLGLPDQFRAVVMLRDVEELSTSETAAALDLSEENVKVRLHRGRAMLRSWLVARVGAEAKNAFPFMGVRCDRVVRGVFLRLAEWPPNIHGFCDSIRVPHIRGESSTTRVILSDYPTNPALGLFLRGTSPRIDRKQLSSLSDI